MDPRTQVLKSCAEMLKFHKEQHTAPTIQEVRTAVYAIQPIMEESNNPALQVQLKKAVSSLLRLERILIKETKLETMN